jgi:hypothetical protein
MILKNKIQNLRLAFKGFPKERMLLWLILLLSAGFILYQSLIIFQVKKLKAVDLYFLSQKKLLDFYDQIMENAGALKKELAEAKNIFRMKKEKFVEEQNLPNYFTHFRELVKSNRLKILALDFKPQEIIPAAQGEPLSYYQKLRFNASLQGDYFDIMHLLYELEYVNPKIFDIQSLRIQQENPRSRQVVTDMDVTVYIFMEKTQNGKI